MKKTNITYRSRRTNKECVLSQGTLLGSGECGTVFELQADGQSTGLVAKMCSTGSCAGKREAAPVIYNELSMLDRLGRLDGYVYDVETSNAYIIMDQVPGVPVCQTFETLPSQDANYDEILRAYTQLEAQGICHGDVHGANVLKTDNGVEIIDFGFCLQIGNFPITRWPWVLKPSAAAIYKKYCYMSFWQLLRSLWYYVFALSFATWGRCLGMYIVLNVVVFATRVARQCVLSGALINKDIKGLCTSVLCLAAVSMLCIALVSLPSIKAIYSLGMLAYANGVSAVMLPIITNFSSLMTLVANLGAVVCLPMMVPTLISEIIWGFKSKDQWLEAAERDFGCAISAS